MKRKQFAEMPLIQDAQKGKAGDHLRMIRDLPRFYALGLMYEKPRYGYEIISSFRKDLNWRISPSLVYPFLKDLESNGLVSASAKRGERRKRVFRLTPLGKQASRSVFLQFSKKMAPGILGETVHNCAGCGRTILGDCYSAQINEKDLAFCCEPCASTFAQTRAKSDAVN